MDILDTDGMDNGVKVRSKYFHSCNILYILLRYRGVPTYAVFTTVDPTTAIFGLCTHKWGIFALVGDTLESTNANYASLHATT